MKSFQLVILFFVTCLMMSGLGMDLKTKVPKGGRRGGGGGRGGGQGAWAVHQGSDPETVKAAILSERPDLNVQIVPHDGK